MTTKTRSYKAAQRVSYTCVVFPSGLFLQDYLETAVTEANIVNLVIGTDFRPGWSMMRPHLAGMGKVAYA